MTEEIWKDAYGLEKYISVSNKGTVYIKPRTYIHPIGNRTIFCGDKIQKLSFDKDGYRIGKISVGGKRYSYRVHRLVLLTHKYIENHESMEVNHIDGNKNNNSIENLEWCTRQENMKHSFDNGLSYMPEENYYHVMIDGKESRKSFIGESSCKNCKAPFMMKEKTSKFCNVECYKEYNKRFIYSSEHREVERPSSEELYKLLLSNNFVQVGNMFGVSDNAVRKWCKSYKIPYKSSYYKSLNK